MGARKSEDRKPGGGPTRAGAGVEPAGAKRGQAGAGVASAGAKRGQAGAGAEPAGAKRGQAGAGVAPAGAKRGQAGAGVAPAGAKRGEAGAGVAPAGAKRGQTGAATERARAKREPGTAGRILDIAERLVQTRGFNNFSYADIASELGITKASLHYHFPGKAELGQALITRYAERFSEALARIDHDLPDARAKLEAYAGLYADVLRGERMCMCGVLAAEYQTLPEPMRGAVIEFFDVNQRWLADLLDHGRADGTLRVNGSVDDLAQSILSTLEGAMLVARPYGDLTRFSATASQLLAGLTP